MIWGDGSWPDIATGVVWCVCQLGIGYYYIFVIGRCTLENAEGVVATVIGGFIYSCGLGHWAMLVYMGFAPHMYEFFRFVVVPVDLATLYATRRAAIESPDVRA